MTRRATVIIVAAAAFAASHAGAQIVPATPSDLALFFPSAPGQIDPRRAHEIINAYTLAFFDRYLRGKPSPLLAAPSPSFPEVTFTRKP